MEVSNILIIDNFLDDPNTYVEQILKQNFVDVSDGEKTFKGIQLSDNQEVIDKTLSVLNGMHIVYNFIRQSPVNQTEPNYIHSDKNMCDVIAILYLNRAFPKDAGTTIHENIKTNSIVDKGEENADEFTKSVIVSMKYNRMVAFPSDLYHSRNLLNNFGTGEDSRLIQVLFLKQNT
jgi:hypothetical protein